MNNQGWAGIAGVFITALTGIVNNYWDAQAKLAQDTASSQIMTALMKLLQECGS